MILSDMKRLEHLLQAPLLPARKVEQRARQRHSVMSEKSQKLTAWRGRT